MRIISVIMSAAVLCLLGAGCAGPERKLSRGVTNFSEITRMGEIQRSVEQATLFGNSDGAFASGFIHGFDRTVARTAVGAYEILTFPIPNHSPKNYGPVFYPEHPVHPDSYTPDWLSDGVTGPDAALGFSGGDIAPMIPGSRFRVFDN